MKKVYDYQQLIYIKGQMNKEFQRISIWDHLHLMSDQEARDKTNTEYFSTFEEFFKTVQEGKIWNAEAWHTCILKRPIVRIICGLNSYHITKRNFVEVYLYHRYSEASNLTMETLMRKLKADEFIEYLQERNIKTLDKS